MAMERHLTSDEAPGGAPLTGETKRRVRLADGQRKGFETAWNEYFDCYASTTYLTDPLIRLEDISYHLYLKKNVNPTNPQWEIPSFRQLKKILDVSQDKLQGIEARLAHAGLLLKESGKGKGARGENVANDYLLYEPLALPDFLAAVANGKLPGTLNEKGQRKLTELRERLRVVTPGETATATTTKPPTETTPVQQQATATGMQQATETTNRQQALTVTPPIIQPVPKIGTLPVPPRRTPPVPTSTPPGVRQFGTENRPPATDEPEQTEQQPRAATTTPPVTATPAVVVATNDELVLRGMTAAVAARLRQTVSAAIIDRQLAIFDYLRANRPDDPHLTPGRLRRQIEEDWAPPPGYRTPDEQAALAAAAAQAQAQMQQQQATAAAATAAAAEARQAELAAVGLSSADQALWIQVVRGTPPLPALFRDALFHAPGDDGAAAVIFRDRATLQRATSAAHTAARAQIVSRVATLSHRPSVTVHYLLYRELQAMLAGSDPATAKG